MKTFLVIGKLITRPSEEQDVRHYFINAENAPRALALAEQSFGVSCGSGEPVPSVQFTVKEVHPRTNLSDVHPNEAVYPL